MPNWIEGIPTIVTLFAIAAAAAVLSLVIASALGLSRFRRGARGGSDPAEQIERLSSLADIARREGLLSLEGHVDPSREPLIACGIAMAVEGADSAKIREALEAEVDLAASRPAARWGARVACSQVPTFLVLAGASLLLITLVAHAQEPAGMRWIPAAAGTLVLLAGVILTGFSHLVGDGARERVGAATMAAILQSTGVLLICAGADGGAVRRQLRALLPGQSTEAGGMAQAA